MNDEGQRVVLSWQDNMERDALESMRIAGELLKANPAMPRIQAVVQAGDLAHMYRADELMAVGVPWHEAMNLLGSYARPVWTKQAVQDGKVTRADVLPHLPALWRGSDPDDTDRWWLSLWVEAWQANNKQTILDGDPLPAGGSLTVYRGQFADDTPGIAWSTDEAVARRFASTGGYRFAGKGEKVLYEARVARSKVLAYLTGRGESETVVDPFDLTVG